ncbi:MAG: AMP-binding protein [Bacteroidales bacterium]|nr:AMP-binding protein [Bacteroidales bacterium]
MNCYDYLFENTKYHEKNFVVGNETISFTNLYEKSLKLANYIGSEYGSQQKILILSANNVFFITVYLAVLKSNNICVPLDSRIEPENLELIKKQTGAQVAFVTPDVIRNQDLSDVTVIVPEKLEEILAQPGKTHQVHTNPGDIAEIIFTSGSTGVPKGVMLSHQNIVANTGSIVEYLHLSENDRMMVVLPFFYCYGLSLLHTHLRCGGSIIMINSFIFLGTVIKALKDYNCSGFAGVPSHFQILLRKTQSFKDEKFPALRYVTQAGGKLPHVFIDEFKEAFPEVKFYVMYGQTEATARLAYLRPSDYDRKKGSIGKAIPGVTLRVVDPEGKDVAPGETGEIIASGDNIMPGYLNDEESTNKTIRNGWLYTGDIGTIDEDGYIFLTARIKEILKVNGKRISPKEIEEVILHIPGIVDCTIEGFTDDIQGEAIKATVVTGSNEQNITENVIKEHCAKHLTLYKIPKSIEFKSNLEVSASGKKVKNKH